MKWYIAVLKKYAVFSGRARRKECWMFILFNTIIHLVLHLLRYAPREIGWEFYQRTGSIPGILPHMELFFIILFFAYSIAVLVPGLAVVARRLHDTGRSGLLLLWGLPGLGITWILRQLYDIHRTVSPTWGLIPIGIFVILIGILTVLKGSPEKNRYGPDPRA